MSKLEVENLYKVFGKTPRKTPASALTLAREGVSKEEIRRRCGATVALAEVSFSVETGETFVVMGLSGSGKSTLLRCLNRLVEPSAGKVLLDGVDLGDLSPAELRRRRHQMGMVFQHFGLMPHRRVLDNVAYGLAVQGMARAERRRQAREWIEAVGLEGYERAYPAELSGGMQQRVGLARALATDPDVLLMDEPFGALDPLIRREMQEELLRLQRRLQKTIVFITHDLDEALRLGDRIAVLRDGRVIQIGEPAEIVLRPADAYVEAFVRDVPRGRVLRARDVMTASGAEAPATERPTIAADTPLEQLLPILLASEDPLAVTGEGGALLGIVSREEMIAALCGRDRG